MNATAYKVLNIEAPIKKLGYNVIYVFMVMRLPNIAIIDEVNLFK